VRSEWETTDKISARQLWCARGNRDETDFTYSGPPGSGSKF
jgi:hypothetical protein